jgi:hypothetical protein
MDSDQVTALQIKVRVHTKCKSTWYFISVYPIEADAIQLGVLGLVNPHCPGTRSLARKSRLSTSQQATTVNQMQILPLKTQLFQSIALVRTDRTKF